MAPKKALLEVLDRESLARIVTDLDLDVDRRSPNAMRASLRRSREATLPFLIEKTTVPYLREALSLLDLPCSGKRPDLVAELLARSSEQPARDTHQSFVAIDFETADYYRDSACQVGMAKVENGRIIDRFNMFLRPPRQQFRLSHIHGITWRDVAKAPTFEEAWPRIKAFISGSAFLAAHNAAFDKTVLRDSAQSAGISLSEPPFVCTVKVAKSTWELPNSKLPTICAYLGLDLDHHNAASDAIACAEILLAAQRQGYVVDV